MAAARSRRVFLARTCRYLLIQNNKGSDENRSPGKKWRLEAQKTNFRANWMFLRSAAVPVSPLRVGT